MICKKLRPFVLLVFLFYSSSLSALSFTVSSYNCGGLANHYDYIRAVSMQGLLQERHDTEPAEMALLKRLQDTALRLRFSNSAEERSKAQREWNEGNYDLHLEKLTSHPEEPNSFNKQWRKKSEAIVTAYNETPVVLRDEEVREILHHHISDLVKGQGLSWEPRDSLNKGLDIARRVMAERIFLHQLKYDIIALQEADYLSADMFPPHYDVRFSNTNHSVNGVAWNKTVFELVHVIGNVEGQGFVVELREIDSGQTVAIASGHLKGSNPFEVVYDEKTGEPDSAKGDKGLQKLIDTLEKSAAEIKIVAMDSNVTATHPRLSLLKEAGYLLDYRDYLEPTCTSPWQILHTRLDWIAVKSKGDAMKIQNIPVLGIGLNSPQTNISDHAPVASKISQNDESPK